jgi:hypothetical protein
MKVRITIPGTAPGARLTALCWGALTLVALVAVSACSGSSTSSPGVPTFSPSVTISGTSTATAPASGGTTTPASGGTTTPASGSTTTSGTPGVTSPAPATHTATAIATATVTITVPPSSQIPTVAPVTGGGGTAGPRDVLLFGLGVAAILAGAGGLAYRRWLTRGR